MQVNMLEAKSQLSKLVKAALEGEDVVIASNGTPLVKLVPFAAPRKLGARGKLRIAPADIDRAFSPEVEAEIARLFGEEP